MKKGIVLSMLFTITALSIFNNAKAQKGFYAGIKSARQVSVMFNSDDVDKPETDYNSNYSRSFIVSGGFNFKKNLGLGTELSYYRAKQHYINNAGGYTQKFTYLKIPLLFTYNGNPDKKFMFTAKAGPQIGILMKSNITGAADNALNGNTKSRYKKMTFGMMAGAGARMRMTNSISLDAGLRLDGTFTDTENKKYHGYQTGRAKTYDLNAGVELGITYAFN